MKYEYPKIQICINCNSLFAEHSYMIFCCKKCKREYLKKQKYRKKESFRQKEMFELLPINEVFETVKRLCSVCDSDISDKRKNAKYCSKECKNTAKREQREHDKNTM